MKAKTKAWFRLMRCKMFHGFSEKNPGVVEWINGTYDLVSRKVRCGCCGNIYSRSKALPLYCNLLQYDGNKTIEEWVEYKRMLKSSLDADYDPKQAGYIFEREG